MNWTPLHWHGWVYRHAAAGIILTLAATLAFVWWINALGRWRPLIETEIWKWHRFHRPARRWHSRRTNNQTLSRFMVGLHRILIVVGAYIYLAFIFNLFPRTAGWTP